MSRNSMASYRLLLSCIILGLVWQVFFQSWRMKRGHEFFSPERVKRTLDRLWSFTLYVRHKE